MSIPACLLQAENKRRKEIKFQKTLYLQHFVLAAILRISMQFCAFQCKFAHFNASLRILMQFCAFQCNFAHIAMQFCVFQFIFAHFNSFVSPAEGEKKDRKCDTRYAAVSNKIGTVVIRSAQ